MPAITGEGAAACCTWSLPRRPAASRGGISMVFSNSSPCVSLSVSTKRSAWWPTVITSPCCSACFLTILPLT